MNLVTPVEQAPAPVRRRIGDRELIWMMAMLMALQAFGIDAILPGLDELATGLDVPGNDRQFVIGAYLLAAGVGALIPGVLADRFGRRPVLLTSAVCYILFSVLSATAATFDGLIVIRAAQGFFGAGIIALPPAIIRDRVGGDKMARMMSLIFVIFLLTPAIAPSIGEVILALGDWRWIFAAMAVQGAIVGTWVFLRLPESLDEANRQPIRPRVVGANMWRAVSRRGSIGYVFGSSLVFGGLFGFINQSQQLIGEAFDAADLFPIIFGVSAGAMAVTNWFNSRIVERFGARRVGHTALLAFIVVSTAQVYFAWFGEETLWEFVPLMATNMALLGFIGTNFGAIAMNPFFDIAGAASSAHSFLRMTTGAVLGATIGYMYDGSARPLAMALLIGGLISLALVLYSERGRLFGTPEAGMGPTPSQR